MAPERREATDAEESCTYNERLSGGGRTSAMLPLAPPPPLSTPLIITVGRQEAESGRAGADAAVWG